MLLSIFKQVSPAILFGIAAYAIVRQISSSRESLQADSLPDAMREARERVAREPHTPSENAIGALGEIARVNVEA